MTIISDSGPIITFARANKLDLLRKVLGKLIIPEAVWQDIVVRGKVKPGAKEVKEADWIDIRSLKDKAKLSNFPNKLGKGEKEAILLAEELKATLLIDDPAARKEAKKRNLPLISTLDILQEAKIQKLIPNVKKTLDQLIITASVLKRSYTLDIIQCSCLIYPPAIA